MSERKTSCPAKSLTQRQGKDVDLDLQLHLHLHGSDGQVEKDKRKQNKPSSLQLKAFLNHSLFYTLLVTFILLYAFKLHQDFNLSDIIQIIAFLFIMARRSPPLVNQKYETGCTWRMFRIFNFHGHSDKRLVSNKKHSSARANGNGNSESSSDVPNAVDEKHLQIGVSSGRIRDYSCRSISCVENDQVADWRNEVTKMTVDQRSINEVSQGKDRAGCQPNQFLDALQILYSNKELFIKLLQDPNSLLVKQIHDLQSSQVKEPYQARKKRMTGLNKSPQSNATQCVKPFKSSDGYDLRSSCNPQSSNRIVVLKPGTVNVKNFGETSFGCPQSHSPNSFSSDARYIRPSHFPFGRIKRKLRHVMRVRRQAKQWMTDDGMSCKSPCSSQGLEDGKKAKELEIAERNSPINSHTNTGKKLNSYVDLKDSELCMGQEAASFCESCGKNTYNTSAAPFEQNILNIHVEGRQDPSQMLNSGIEECKQCTNSLGRSIPLPDFLSLSGLHRYCDHSSISAGMRYYNNDQMALRTRLRLQKEENGSYNSLGPKIMDPPVAIVKIPTDKLQPFDEDVGIGNSFPGNNLHVHYDIPRDGRYKDGPTQNIDTSHTTRGSGSFLDLYPEIQDLSFSPEIASSSPSSYQRTEYNVNMGNKVDHPNTESVVEKFIGDDVTNSPITTFKPDESPVQVMHDNKFEEKHFADNIRSSSDPMNNLTLSEDILDYTREILQTFSMKWDELSMKVSSDQLLDPSTFDELKELTGQLSSSTILLDCIIEAFMNVHQNRAFPLHVSSKNSNAQAYVVKKLLVKEITELVNLYFHPHPSPLKLEQLVEKDLARHGSWLNVQVYTEDIAIEVEEDVLEKLVLEITSEMDIRDITHCNQPMSTYFGDNTALWWDYRATIF
ncbi:hypothetical protein VNO77_00546 [Canavalia gladiata]|uniref:DUF4378 domain-containing protein n=1 Tax=Canavalia gladiata TaxID=3824 RepID=A0AAN9R4G7_CANGL